MQRRPVPWPPTFTPEPFLPASTTSCSVLNGLSAFTTRQCDSRCTLARKSRLSKEKSFFSSGVERGDLRRGQGGDGIAVGRLAEERREHDAAAAARLVDDHHGLAQRLPRMLRHLSGHDVGRRPGSRGVENRDGFVGKPGRVRPLASAPTNGSPPMHTSERRRNSRVVFMTSAPLSCCRRINRGETSERRKGPSRNRKGRRGLFRNGSGVCPRIEKTHSSETRGFFRRSRRTW